MVIYATNPNPSVPYVPSMWTLLVTPEPQQTAKQLSKLEVQESLLGSYPGVETLNGDSVRALMRDDRRWEVGHSVHLSVAIRLVNKLVSANEGECWELVGRYGLYGTISIGRRATSAHRVAYAMRKGVIPKGMVIAHSCDNPRCVNPDHLRIATHMENSQDSVERGRLPHTPNWVNWRANLTDKSIFEIRRMCFEGVDHSQIAQQFGIPRTFIHRLKVGVTQRSIWDAMKQKTIDV